MKILLAYDGFEHSQHALEEAARSGLETGASVTVVSVVPEAEARASKAGGHRVLAPHGHIDVSRAHEFLAERGVESDMKVLYGDPADELVREAADGNYDTLVVGSHGRGRVGRLVLGSVGHELMNRLQCELVIAGPDATERHEAGSATG
jgi:nucleotide-binding universal stress UspA family protein